jgi:hypothetical protein
VRRVSTDPQTSLPASSSAPYGSKQSVPGETGGPQVRRGVDLWLHRISVLTFVFVCATTGVLLILLPWRPEWTDNYLLLRFPGLRPTVASGFFRGLCSGLGILDIWVGFWEAVHYDEHRPPHA